MMLTESMKRSQAWVGTIAPHKPSRTQDSWKLYSGIVREGKPMFWQLLARLIPRCRPGHTGTAPTAETVTPEPPYDTVLAEVYFAHAAIHGTNKLLPRHLLPSSSSCRTPEKAEKDPR